MKEQRVLNIKATLLQRAAGFLGKEKLAVRLNVPVELLDAWMSGMVDMPDSKLPRLSAILSKEADKPRGDS
jgi:hypothetical protein